MLQFNASGFISFAWIKWLVHENKKKLIEVNSKLWDLENSKRAAEKKGEFGKKFIADARDVYKLNDERAKIKLAINNILGSNIREVKSHEWLISF